MKNRIMEEAPLVRLAVCLMVGIAVGEYVCWPWLLLLVGSVAAVLLAWRWPLVQSVAIAVSFVVLGGLLVERQERSLRVVWPEGEVCYEAVVTSEPVEKPKTMAVDLLLTGSGRRLKGYLYKDERSRRLKVGDGLRIQSRIRENSSWRIGTFDYRRYLEVHGFTGSTFVSSRKWQRAQVSLAGLSRLERTRLFFLRQRSRLLERLRTETADADDAYAVVAAMTLGDKTALTRDLKEVYSATGASHVLALSGLHLGIVYTLLSLLLGGRRSLFTIHSIPEQSSPIRSLSLFTIIGLWAFVLLVGMPVSVVRSFTEPDLGLVCNGGPLTIELHDSAFAMPDGVEKVAHLVKFFIERGGHQMQINTINRETLLDAQAHPERHRHLIVRVWGWSGYFIELDKEYQNQIIKRVELR